MKKGSLKVSLISLSLVLIMFSVSYAKVPDNSLSQKKAVVSIYIYEKNEQKFFGSGFIIDSTGIVATNYHVISSLLSENTSVAIRMENGDFVKAERIIGIDEDRDVALIKLDGKDFPSVKLARDYKPQQGDDVVVIGSPFGLETTVSNGIISSIRGKDEFLQITAPISPGNSGSPVFNAAGEIIGIATLLIQGGQNLNFAIPAKYIESLSKSLTTPKAKLPTLTNATPDQISKGTSQEDTPEYHVKLATEYMDNSNYEEAIKEYTKAITLKSDDASLFYRRGEAKDFQESIEDFSKAISLDPKNGVYFFSRYKSYLWIEKYELALPDINRAIELKKNSPDLDIFSELFSYRGVLYIKTGQFDKAFEDYKKAIKIDPDAYLSYPSASSVSQDHFSDCFKFFNKMIALRSKDSFLYSARSEFYSKLKQYDKAINDLSKAILLHPDSIFNYSNRGFLYINKGALEKAKKDFQKVCHWENGQKYYKGQVDRACYVLAKLEKDEARGVQWVRFGISEKGTELFYNKDKIRQQANKNFRVWVSFERGEKPPYLKEEKEKYSHSLQLCEYDCRRGKIGILSSIDYAVTGGVLASYDYRPMKMKPIVPDSIADILAKIICSNKKKGKVLTKD